MDWDSRLEVEVSTLDALIARHGEPAFVKIDVEGHEAAVLDGLSRPPACVSVEYLPRALGGVEACIQRLERLAAYRYNWSPGESFALGSSQWLDAAGLLAALRSPEAQRVSGDVYAQRADRS